MNLKVHPEVGQSYLMNLADVSRKRADLSYEAAKDKAWVDTWNQCMKDTNDILTTLAYCPGSDAVVEDYERYLAMEDAIDDYEEAFQEEDF